MPVPDAAVRAVRLFCEARTPPELRDRMRLEVDVRGNTATISDCRPVWDGAALEWTRLPIAQLRYDPSAEQWTLYWADSNDRWHRYDDLEPTDDLDEVLAEIDDDPTSIFFG